MILKYLSVMILVLVAVAICLPLFNIGYFSHHDDLQVMRIYEMRMCFQDLQLPCRWVADMGWGNGYPMFNYYSALPYYIGAIFSYVVGYVWAAKMLFLLVLVLGIFSMYLLVRELFGEWPGVVAGVVFGLAPYRALDSFVRGAIAESFAIVLVPLVFYAVVKLVRHGGVKWIVLTAVSLAAFLLCHNIMTLFFLPLIGAWIIGWGVSYRQRWLSVLISLGLGFGLAAFFLMPAYLEKSLVQTDNLTRLDLDFRAHFVTWKQLFLDRSWGYGASTPGVYDGISYQIGWPQWWLVGLAGIGLVIGWRRFGRMSWVVLFWLIAFMLSVIMTHTRSAVIWEPLSLLHYAQFPWRWLSVAIVASGVLAGAVIFVLPKRYQLISGLVVMVLAVGLNWSYFQPQKYYPAVDDQAKLSGELWEEQRRAAIFDYLPVGALEPKEGAPTMPIVRQGSAEVSNYLVRSNQWRFNVEATESALVEVPVYDFPRWQVYLNGQLVDYRNDNMLRRVAIDLAPGSYQVKGWFSDTPIRTVANLISLFSLSLILLLIIYGQIQKHRR